MIDWRRAGRRATINFWLCHNFGSRVWRRYTRHVGDPTVFHRAAAAAAAAVHIDVGRTDGRQGLYSSSAAWSGSHADSAVFVRMHYSRSLREKFALLASQSASGTSFTLALNSITPCIQPRGQGAITPICVWVYGPLWCWPQKISPYTCLYR